MGRKKGRKSRTPAEDDPLPTMLPDFGDEEAMAENVYHLFEDRPDLMGELFESITSLVESFVKEHGREPTGDELADMVFGDISEEELASLEEDSEELAWSLGLTREVEEWGVDEDVDPVVVTQHCANCSLPMSEGGPYMSIGAKLFVLPFRSSQDAAVFYLPVVSHNRLVAGILVPPNSPARKDGWDIVFPICCDKCGKELRELLSESVATHIRDLQN